MMHSCPHAFGHYCSQCVEKLTKQLNELECTYLSEVFNRVIFEYQSEAKIIELTAAIERLR